MTVLTVLALVWGVYVAVRARDASQPASESLLLACMITPLVLLGEEYLLSALPIDRPLRWLPLEHIVLTLGVLAFTLRRGGLRGWRDALIALLRGARESVVEVGPLLTLAMVVVGLNIAACFYYGAYFTPQGWDELECHVPIAVQPYQDGRLGTPTSDQLTVSTYSRGNPLLWYWTLQWTGTDLLFHPVQATFGLVLLLSTWVLARRSHASVWGAALAVVVVGTAPLFNVLSTVGYVDIPHAACVIAMLAFLAPGRPGEPMARSWLAAAAAFSASCAIKYPLLPLVLAAIACTQAVLFREGLVSGVGSACRFIASRRGVLALLVIAASCNLYIHHWIVYGNPFYILTLKVGSHTIFNGPCDTDSLDACGMTSVAKPVAEMSRFERLYYSWTDFEGPLLVESFGSFGPVLPFALLLPAVAAVLLALRRRDTWRLALALMVLFCLLCTPAHVPRYGLVMFVLIVLCAALALGELSFRPAYALVVVALCGVGLRTGLSSLDERYDLCRERLGYSWRSRTGAWLERYSLFPPHSASPEVVRYIRDHSGPGDEVVWTVRTVPSLLLNRNWSNRTRHLAGCPEEYFPLGAHRFPRVTPDQLAAWTASMKSTRPRHVLVYARSQYAEHLLNHPQLGYRTGFREGPHRGEYAMIVFERVD